MPLPDQTDFSYETSIAPAFSRYFGEMRRDPRLSSKSVERLQSTVFRQSADIEEQRAKIREEQDRSLLRNLSAQQTLLSLDEQRRRRDEEDRQNAETQTVAKSIRDIATADIPDSEKRKRLRDATIGGLGTAVSNPQVARMLDIAHNAFPEPQPLLTPAQMIQMGMEGVPPEVLATQDPYLIGQFAAASADAKARRVAMEKRAFEAVEKDEAHRHAILREPIKFRRRDEAADPNAPDEFDEESKVSANVVVKTWGSPDERKQFDEAKNDAARLIIAQNIRIRQLSGGGGVEDKKRKAAGIVGGR